MKRNEHDDGGAQPNEQGYTLAFNECILYTFECDVK